MIYRRKRDDKVDEFEFELERFEFLFLVVFVLVSVMVIFLVYLPDILHFYQTIQND